MAEEVVLLGRKVERVVEVPIRVVGHLVDELGKTVGGAGEMHSYYHCIDSGSDDDNDNYSDCSDDNPNTSTLLT